MWCVCMCLLTLDMQTNQHGVGNFLLLLLLLLLFCFGVCVCVLTGASGDRFALLHYGLDLFLHCVLASLSNDHSISSSSFFLTRRAVFFLLPLLIPFLWLVLSTNCSKSNRERERDGSGVEVNLPRRMRHWICGGPHGPRCTAPRVWCLFDLDKSPPFHQ